MSNRQETIIFSFSLLWILSIAVAQNPFSPFRQLGYQSSFMCTLPQHIALQVVESETNFKVNIRLWQFFVFLALIPFVFVRTLKYLALFSTLANLLTVVGLAVILQHCMQGLPPASHYPAFNSWATLPLFFGTVVYAFEGIGVVSVRTLSKWCHF